MNKNQALIGRNYAAQHHKTENRVFFYQDAGISVEHVFYLKIMRYIIKRIIAVTMP
jgi:hypothetical protein